ncbi:MAG: integrase [Pusillimonas sp.]|nr:integrase [Pusillimonas sp.]MBC41816.1 integrase [Pusillimonas sp.]|tara:strand:+ start:37154 stop:38410 length:1257 start_codon:yes stop_codon:yes gene_type:complete
MAKSVTPLTDTKCRQAKYQPDGAKKLFDGGGLYLELMKNGTKKWRMKFRQPDGKENRLTLGDYPAVSLQSARDKRREIKTQIEEGKNPAIERELAKQAVVMSQNETFEAIAKEWLVLKQPSWSEGYYKRIRNALKSNVHPYIGNLPITQIPGKLVLNVVQKVEKRGALEMASRVLDAIGMVFKYAVGTGRAQADVTAGLSQFLQDRPPVRHFPHVDEDGLPELLKRIENYSGRPETIFAIKIMMRTFPRTSEMRFAQWSEIDLENAMWVIPPSRMKGRIMAKLNGPSHLIPLSRQAVEILADLKKLTGRHNYILPGAVNPATAPISAETMNKALKIMGYKDQQTGHGFRGLASTLMNESGLFRKEVIEAQLSHKKEDDVEGAYNHAVYLKERIKLMQWWSDYLDERAATAKHAPDHQP